MRVSRSVKKASAMPVGHCGCSLYGVIRLAGRVPQRTSASSRGQRRGGPADTRGGDRGRPPARGSHPGARDRASMPRRLHHSRARCPPRRQSGSRGCGPAPAGPGWSDPLSWHIHSYLCRALCVVSQQLLVEIDRDGELVDADVLVFPVHGCVLLVVDIDGHEADHGVGEVCEASRVRACRQDERGDGGVGKDRLRRLLHVLIAAAVEGRGGVVFVVLVAQDDLHAVTRCHLAQGVEIFFKVRVVDAAQKCLRPAGAVVIARDVLKRAARAEHFTRCDRGKHILFPVAQENEHGQQAKQASCHRRELQTGRADVFTGSRAGHDQRGDDHDGKRVAHLDDEASRRAEDALLIDAGGHGVVLDDMTDGLDQPDNRENPQYDPPLRGEIGDSRFFGRLIKIDEVVVEHGRKQTNGKLRQAQSYDQRRIYFSCHLNIYLFDLMYLSAQMSSPFAMALGSSRRASKQLPMPWSPHMAMSHSLAISSSLQPAFCQALTSGQ